MKVAIIGAGIAGASVAYHLRAAGADVVVVDQAHAGKATLAGAGIVCPWATATEDPAFFDLYAAGAAYYGRLIPELESCGEDRVGYGRVGALVVGEDPDELTEIRRRVTDRASGRPEVGDVRRLDPVQALALFPLLRPDLEAIFIAGGARVDGAALATALLRVAQPEWVETRGEPAELDASGGRIHGIRVHGRPIGADSVVVAGGAWAAASLSSLGIDHPVEPQKGQIVHLGLSGVNTSRWPVLLPPGPHYLLAFDDSRVVVGATRETGSGFDVRVTAAGQAEILRTALTIAPGLADATVIETRVGLRPVTGDLLPIVGPVPGVDGLYVCNGLGAGGLTMGPLAGRLVADVVVGRPAELDLSPYLPRPT